MSANLDSPEIKMLPNMYSITSVADPAKLATFVKTGIGTCKRHIRTGID